ncbi:MAG TPA: hypothetical protein VHB25_12190 [Gemmatimonadaceae bacterium]|nr:hypothetical protein [Gemmatimonadaceae bacterium]
MRTTIKWTLVSLAVAAAACSKTPQKTTALSDDLKQDLQLASQTQNIQISPDEVAPQAKKVTAVRPKSAPHGNKVVRSQHPTVKASPKPVEVAEAKTDIPEVQVTQAAPAPSQTQAPDAPPMARPSPIPATSYPGSSPGQGQGNGRAPGDGGGPGIGATIGGILGGILIGGDDDHCEPPGRRRGGRVGGGVYGRPGSWPRGGMGGIGGIGGRIGGGFPINPLNRP